jgi:hypothetical protein
MRWKDVEVVAKALLETKAMTEKNVRDLIRKAHKAALKTEECQ